MGRVTLVGRSRSEPVGPRYSGPAVISDGVTEYTHNVEIHATIGEHAATTAWHIIVKERMSYAFSSPLGKPMLVELPNGTRCSGSVVDPKLIRGTGSPPC